MVCSAPVGILKMSDKPVAAGNSSFDLIDAEKAFAMIDVKPDSHFLDLACGLGHYSIEVSTKIGEKGVVYAVDLWQEGIDALKREIGKRGIENIKPIVADMRNRLPIEERSIDSCLLATILHDLSKSDQESTLQEIVRLMKPDGMLTIIEFKKIDKGPGPPLKIRMEEEEIEALVTQYGFARVAGSEVGEFNYLVKYQKIRQHIIGGRKPVVIVGVDLAGSVFSSLPPGHAQRSPS
jgi:ubiquinone/menaquinone biosynthesis C-methylase UbiE